MYFKINKNITNKYSQYVNTKTYQYMKELY